MGHGTYVVNLDSGMILTPGTTMQNIAVDGAVGVGALNKATTHVLIGCDTNAVAMTLDGTTPVAANNGHVLPTGYEKVWSKELAAGMKFIKVSGAGVVRVTELCPK